MKYFLVVRDKTHVLSVTEYNSALEANLGLDNTLASGQTGSVYSVDSRENLGINIGDTWNAEDSDEMDFRGFDGE